MAEITHESRLRNNYQKYFASSMPLYTSLNHILPSQERYFAFFKTVLYFSKAILEPLARQGMHKNDTIIDIASGDGEMSVALGLQGYENITLADLDEERLKRASELLAVLLPKVKCNILSGNAAELEQRHDVLISHQTIEHLSEQVVHSIASRACQIKFLQAINTHTQKLCYLNAPNFWYFIDGHDTRLPFYHFLPIGLRHYLREKGMVTRSSWSGICQPVSLGMLKKYLKCFKLASNYYAFDNMLDYVKNYPPYDFMGKEISALDVSDLPLRKKIIRFFADRLGGYAQNILPTLSVIFKRI